MDAMPICCLRLLSGLGMDVPLGLVMDSHRVALAVVDFLQEAVAPPARMPCFCYPSTSSNTFLLLSGVCPAQ